MLRWIGGLLTAATLAACAPVVVTTDAPVAPVTPSSVPEVPDELQTSAQATRAFAQVTRRVEPVAERECLARTNGVNCDFRIVIDKRPRLPANAYQTLDESGRPIIGFTIALIEDARNEDELAFVMGHEAAHHVAGHIERQRENAEAGAIIFGGLASVSGGDAAAVETAIRIGQQVGARSYSKEFELEADALGTVITARAGYDPLKGAQFFNRIPDPGDRFLGTHPPNAQRLETVRRVAAGL